MTETLHRSARIANRRTFAIVQATSRDRLIQTLIEGADKDVAWPLRDRTIIAQEATPFLGCGRAIAAHALRHKTRIAKLTLGIARAAIGLALVLTTPRCAEGGHTSPTPTITVRLTTLRLAYILTRAGHAQPLLAETRRRTFGVVQATPFYRLIGATARHTKLLGAGIEVVTITRILTTTGDR
jgi:hypothetical protein